MANIVIDKDLNKHLGLPEDYQIDKVEAFKLWQYFMSLFEQKAPINPWIIQYYVEVHGDFINNPKDKRDRIVKDIVENMSNSDRYEVHKDMSEYFELLKESEKSR